MITINYLKDLFFEKYGSFVFIKTPPEVLVTLTRNEYIELNNDLISMTGRGILLLIDESDITFMDPDEILYTRINVANACEFLIKLGDKFSFDLNSQHIEYGEEDL